jgi:hypothetical protein
MNRAESGAGIDAICVQRNNAGAPIHSHDSELKP